MPIVPTKTLTATETGVTIAASLMLAISSAAMLISWGMMAAGAILQPVQKSLVHIAATSNVISCPIIPVDNAVAASLTAAQTDALTSVWQQLKVAALAGDTSHLAQLLPAYQQMFITTMRANPALAKKYILPWYVVDKFSPLSSNCVPQPVSRKSGKLEEFHIDFLSGGNFFEWRLVSSNEIIPLHIIGPLSHALETSIPPTVEVRNAFAVNNEFLVEAREVQLATGAGGEVADQIVQPTLGEKRVLVTMDDYFMPKDDLYNLVFGPPPGEHSFFSHSLNAYLKEASYGKLWITGDVLVLEPGVVMPTTGYQYYIHIFQRKPDQPQQYCGVVESLGLPYTNIDVDCIKGGEIHTLAHEFGHMFGLGHSYLDDCGTVALSVRPEQCKSTEYGGRPDMMGGTDGHYSPSAKQDIKWFDSNNIAVHSGTDRTKTYDYVLDAYSLVSPGYKVLRVSRSAGNLPLWLAFRYPGIGSYDGTSDWSVKKPADVVNGEVLVYHGTTEVDASPQEATYDTLRFKPGTSLIDPSTGTVIENIGFEGTVSSPHMRLRVRPGKKDLTPPAVSLVQFVPAISGTVSLHSAVLDLAGIDRVEFFIDRLMVETVTTRDPASGQYVKILDSRTLENGSHKLEVVAYDKSCTGVPGCEEGNRGTSGEYTFSVNNPDLEGPDIMIADPPSAGVINNPVFVNLRLADQSGIKSVVGYFDNQAEPAFTLVPEASPKFYNFFNYYFLTAGAHTLKTLATDIGGNTSQTDVVFTVNPDTTPPEITFFAVPPGELPPTKDSIIIDLKAHDNVAIKTIEIVTEQGTRLAWLEVPYPSTGEFSLSIPLAQWPEGGYKIYAVVTDFSGNVARSDGFAVQIGEVKFRRGDSNGDGVVNVADVSFTLNAIYQTTPPIPVIPCFDAADANDDGNIDISDAMKTLLYLFVGPSPIPPPGPTALGPDPTNDFLDCALTPLK